MKITMYELLGLVKDGKELPKLKNKAESDFAYYVYDKLGETCNLKDLKNLLNDTVEIIEQEKKIPEKLDVIDYEKCIHEVTHKENQLALEIRDTQIAFNEIIDYLDYLKSKGK